jgi:tetratricopeptide (TPR) repeat protein
MKGRKLFPLAVVVAGLLAYHNSFTGVFVNDDFESIPENPTIRHLWPIWQPLSPPHQGLWHGRPLVNLSLAINYALGGLRVWGYHALNLAVHLLASLTLFGITRRTLRQSSLRERFGAAADKLALAIALLWTVHPLQTESVTYLIQRAESMMGLFYLLTLYCFIRGVESPRTGLWHGLSVTACALGMASKEVMVTAPVMVLLYDRAFVSGSIREAWRRRRPLYLGLSATWIVLGWLLASAGSFSTASANAQHMGLDWQRYLASQPGVILYYLRLSLWPSPLSMNHAWSIASTWTSILPPAAVVLALLVATAWAWRTNPAWGFLGAWFFLILAVSSSFIPLVDLVYEHRMYLSLAAVASLVVLGTYSLLGRGTTVVFVAMAIGLGFLTERRNQDYRNEVIFWNDAVAKSPQSPMAWNNLGIALARAGKLQAAAHHYELAIRLNPSFAGAENNLGLALLQLGRTEDAIRHCEQAVRLVPEFAQAHCNLGNALLESGRTTEAIEQYGQALRINPYYRQARNNIGNALRNEGEVDEAIEQYEQALQIDPDYGTAHYNLGLALEETGRIPEAVRHYKQALRLAPDLAEAHYNLGLALLRQGRVEEAIEQWNQYLKLRPDHAEAYNNLGSALLGLGKVTDAIEQYEQSLRINPDYAKAHYNLGTALERVGRVREAIGQYEQALRLAPNLTEAQKRLAHARAVPSVVSPGESASP